MSDEPKSYPRRDFLAQVAAVPALAAVASQWQPNQALAQTATAMADPLVIAPLSEAELVREVEALMRFVDPAIAYRHTPIDPERNAWPYFEKAIKAYVEAPDDEEYDEAHSDFVEADRPPSDKMRARMLAWVKQNEPACELLDKGIAVGELELPRSSESIRLRFAADQLGDLRWLARVKELSSRLALLDGDINLAMREAASILQLSRIMLRSECLLVDYLVASSIYEIGRHAMYCAVMDEAATVKQAREAVRDIANIDAQERFVHRAWRVELCRSFLPHLARFPATNDASVLANCYVLSDFTKTPELTDAERIDYVRRIDYAKRIFAGHPRLFDREATVRLASTRIRTFVEQSNVPIFKRDRASAAELRTELLAWPRNIRPYGAFMAAAVGDKVSPDRLSDKELEAARKSLATVDNLFGRILVYESQCGYSPIPPELTDARLAAKHLRIALSHYEREHGALPDSLEELIKDGWYASVPLDPFDREPFRYARELRHIWSVGPGGDNDPKQHEPHDEEDAYLENEELCWRIPRVPAA